MNLDQAFEYFIPYVENALKAVLLEPPASSRTLYGMMGYHMGWLDENFSSAPHRSGKRLRPILCLLVCKAAKGDPLDAVPMAAALEFLHNFSLVHDDIQDHSPTRRHRKTVWRIWGQPHAINVGDALFATAYLCLSKLGGRISGHRLSAAYESFSNACLRLCEGQYMDMAFETQIEVSEVEYLTMIEGKTGALLSCAAHVGALAATDDERVVGRYKLFGEKLGLAFQVQDDILGIWGDPKATGKPTADDLLQRKKTLPIVYALKREAELGEHILRDFYAQDSIKRRSIPTILGLLDRLQALDYVRAVNESYCDDALEQLRLANGDPEVHKILEELVERLRERPS
jgi:geranylgeranyl diphosphate synthase, type I